MHMCTASATRGTKWLFLDFFLIFSQLILLREKCVVMVQRANVISRSRWKSVSLIFFIISFCILFLDPHVFGSVFVLLLVSLWFGVWVKPVSFRCHPPCPPLQWLKWTSCCGGVQDKTGEGGKVNDRTWKEEQNKMVIAWCAQIGFMLRPPLKRSKSKSPFSCCCCGGD